MIVLICVFYIICGDSRHIQPPERGFYGVKKTGGNVEFVKIEHKNFQKLHGDDTEITAWNFSLVRNSSQINTVQDQEDCGGCWAFASADVAGASLFLNHGTNQTMSPQYEIDCGGCHVFNNEQYCQDGCKGGYPLFSLADIETRGAVSSRCKAYKAMKKTCSDTCDNGYKATFYSDNYFDYYFAYHEDMSFIRELVTTSGPCVAEMTVYSDLPSYTGGVYQHSSSARPGDGHAVTIYGFGTENGQNYWLIKNSWGPTWGDHGFFKIRLGVNESGIEQNVYSLYNNLDFGPYPNVPMPTQTTPGPYWNVSYDYNSTDVDVSSHIYFSSMNFLIPLIVGGLMAVVGFGLICCVCHRARKRASLARANTNPPNHNMNADVNNNMWGNPNLNANPNMNMNINMMAVPSLSPYAADASYYPNLYTSGRVGAGAGADGYVPNDNNMYAAAAQPPPYSYGYVYPNQQQQYYNNNNSTRGYENMMYYGNNSVPMQTFPPTSTQHTPTQTIVPGQGQGQPSPVMGMGMGMRVPLASQEDQPLPLSGVGAGGSGAMPPPPPFVAYQ